MNNDSRAKTADEIRDEFLGQCRAISRYWATVDGEHSTQDRLDGLLHSVLCVIDGVSGGFDCSLDLVCRPHPDDKAFVQEDGENWIEDGTVINAADMLHELAFRRQDAR